MASHQGKGHHQKWHKDLHMECSDHWLNPRDTMSAGDANQKSWSHQSTRRNWDFSEQLVFFPQIWGCAVWVSQCFLQTQMSVMADRRGADIVACCCRLKCSTLVCILSFCSLLSNTTVNLLHFASIFKILKRLKPSNQASTVLGSVTSQSHEMFSSFGCLTEPFTKTPKMYFYWFQYVIAIIQYM